MKNDKESREYLNFSPSAGYPAGSDIFYECECCGSIIPSLPKDSIHCECRNIMIDVDYGRVSIHDISCIRLFRENS